METQELSQKWLYLAPVMGSAPCVSLRILILCIVVNRETWKKETTRKTQT
jgi:hypothetical protein